MQPDTTIKPIYFSITLNAQSGELTKKVITADKLTKALRTYEPIVSVTQKCREISDSHDLHAFVQQSVTCIMGSGVFAGGCEVEHLKQHSGLVWLHIIVPNQDRLARLKTALQSDTYVSLSFIDVTGKGLWIAFRVEYKQPDDQQAFFNQLSDYCRDSYGIADGEIDPGGQKLTQRVPLSHDPDAYVNVTGEPMVLLEEYKTSPVEQVEPATAGTEPIAAEPDPTPVAEPATRQDDLLSRLLAEQHRPEQEAKQEPEAEQQDRQGKSGSECQSVKDVIPFPVNVFPPAYRWIIEENAKHQLFKPDWLGSSIMLAASVAVGNMYGTRWKNYQQKATIYLAIVGPPGSNKSGPFDYALKPLHETDANAYQLYKQQSKDYDRWTGLSKAQRENEGLPALIERPVYKAILVSDITPEALVFHHQNNPVGLGLAVDELAAWFNNFGRYSKGSEQESWLSNWSFGIFKSFRLGRGANVIEQPSISIGGTIQPGILSELAKDSRSQSGFIDRILFAYPDGQKKPKDSDTELDPRVTESYHQYINNLLSLRDEVKTDENGRIVTQWVPFAPDAFKVMRKWRDQNTDQANNTESDALKGLYAKFDAYIIRFCLILELLDWSCGDSDLSSIRLDTVNRAAELAEYFRQNAVKVLYQLNDQTPSERLPVEQQRLFAVLPEEVTTAEAIAIGASLTPPVSESTVKRLLGSTRVFKRTAYGEYYKLY